MYCSVTNCKNDAIVALDGLSGATVALDDDAPPRPGRVPICRLHRELFEEWERVDGARTITLPR